MIETASSLLNNLAEIPEACRICQEEPHLNVQACIGNVIKLQKGNPSSEVRMLRCFTIKILILLYFRKRLNFVKAFCTKFLVQTTI